MPNKVAKGKIVKLGEDSNATTAPGRLTFPKGASVKVKNIDDKEASSGKLLPGTTYFAGNPSNAAAGALSGGNGNNPASGAWANFNRQQNSASAMQSYRAGEKTVDPLRQFRSSTPITGTPANPWTGQTGQGTSIWQYLAGMPYFQNAFAGAQPITPPTAQPTAPSTKQPTNAMDAYRQGEKNVAKPVTSYSGTAGMYTYGQFSDPNEAFASLLERNVPTNIPSYMADSMGLSTVLSQPDSGWTLQGGNWVQTSTPGTAGAGGSGGGGGGGGGGSGGASGSVIPISNFQNTGGANNTDFANTAYAQWAAANNIPFTEQLRWDPRRGKYVTVGSWLEDKKKRQTKRSGGGGGGYWNENSGGGYWEGGSDQQTTPAAFTGSWGVVNFNTGSG